MSFLRIPVTPADHVQGPDDAPVTMVEYGDYECPFCGLAFPNVKLAQKRFGKKLRFVFRHFPLTEAHPFAEAAAEAAEYAGTHDRFWEMHDGLYANQDELGLALILGLGRALGTFRSRAARCAGAAALRCKDTSRFPRRRAQRRQWNTIVLHQRREARRLLFVPRTRRGDRRAFADDTRAMSRSPVSIVRAAS